MRLAPDLLRVPAGAGALHVARWGHETRHVVLVHGFGTHGFVWRHVGPTLARAGVVAWAPDLLGHGESDRPRDAEFGVAAQADALQRALAALRLGAVILVGLDFGGAVAMRLAASDPDRVSHLVLVNPMTPRALPSADVAALPADAARLALRIGQGVLGAAPLVEALLARQWGSPEQGPPSALVARYLAPFAGRDGARHLLALGAALDRDDMAELDLGAVVCPVLVVRGERERWLDADDHSALAAAFPAGRFETVPGAGRLVPEDAPDWLAERIVTIARERRTLVGKARPSR
ncbi:MAG: alpha/beta fold hydrolase [Gemmatimonadota bacterium]|nr:alpha/beta hydrolase [Gemmatimonadota bacterium]